MAPIPLTLPIECRLINASVAAYSIAWSAAQNQWTIDTTSANYANIGLSGPPTCFADGIDSINAGFVGETTDNWVFLVFRGTLPPFTGDFWAWIDDWLQDFEVGPVPWMVNNTQFGSVESGFANATLALWPLVTAALAPIDLKSKTGIFITGHSKGAAMTFLAATLLKAAYPTMLVRDCCFAAPLTCDRAFRASYDALGLGPLTIRYQNEDDVVPFLPWVPTLDLLAAAERLDPKRIVKKINAHLRASAVQNDYVAPGMLRYITTSCAMEYGDKGAHDAFAAIIEALLTLQFQEIAEAHSAVGRYLTCVCASVASAATAATRA